MKPEISVIIPSFNRCSLLPRALHSVIEQKAVSFEILVVDDGSTDGTREMLLKDFPQVSYFAQSNQGPSAARNRGIEKARGQWIAFLDSDDEWLPGKLRAQLDFFSQNPGLKIAQTEEIWIRNGVRVNPMNKHKKFGGMIFEKCLPLCIVSPSAVMIHRSLFEEVGLFDETLPACEDYDLWLQIAAHHPVGLLSEPYLKKYGGHPDQTSHKYPAMDRFRIQSLVKLLKAGTLSNDQSLAAQKMLQEKTRIFLQGAAKHGNHQEAEIIRSLTAPLLSPRS